MNRRQKRTLTAIFTDPVPANIPWADIVSLFDALGVEVKQGRGSRVRVSLNDEKAVFHRPHPENETDKGSVKSVRRFLSQAGVNIDDI